MSLNHVVDGIDQATQQNEANAAVVFTASGRSRGPLTTDLTSRQHSYVADEPPNLAGDDEGPTPTELALGGLISCQVVVYRFWAERLGIRLDDISITAEGDLDVRGFFGLKEGVRPGFSAVRFAVTLSGPETEERYQQLRQAVDEHCPVLDLFSNPTPVTSTLQVQSGATVSA